MDPLVEVCINLIVFMLLLTVAFFVFTAKSVKPSAKHREQTRVPKNLPDVAKVNSSSEDRLKRCVGVVKRYSSKNCMGFISCEAARAQYVRDVQLLREDWEAHDLSVGCAVTFSVSCEDRPGCPKGRPWAMDVKPLEGREAEEVKHLEEEDMLHSAEAADSPITDGDSPAGTLRRACAR